MTTKCDLTKKKNASNKPNNYRAIVTPLISAIEKEKMLFGSVPDFEMNETCSSGEKSLN